MGMAARKIDSSSRTRARNLRPVFDLPPTVEERLEALEGQANEAPADAARFVVETLERTELEADWRDALISAAEQLRFDDPLLRARLARALLRHAHELDATADTPALWSALRRYASLSSADEVLENLPHFLALSCARTTQQSALQALENTFGASAPKFTPPALAKRVEELAATAMSGTTAEERALALSAIVTAACLELPSAKDMILKADPQHAETLRRFLLRELTRIASTRKEPGGAVAACLAQLQT